MLRSYSSTKASSSRSVRYAVAGVRVAKILSGWKKNIQISSLLSNVGWPKESCASSRKWHQKKNYNIYTNYLHQNKRRQKTYKTKSTNNSQLNQLTQPNHRHVDRSQSAHVLSQNHTVTSRFNSSTTNRTLPLL